VSCISLRAVDEEKNMDRLYVLSPQKGLFGSFCIYIRNARYGKSGQQRIYAFETEEEALAFMNQKVKQKLHTHYELEGTDQ
jgi:predicted DNA-binding WGR domain protein